MPLSAGTRIGPYDVVGPLGAGGMGEVYRARDSRLGREVAVKTLPATVSHDPDRLRRFEQEARSTGLLNHPNILAVFDVGTHEGAPYVVSELLEGETLRDRIGGQPLPVRKAIDYAVQIARGLAAAHDKGVVHRDLKPENLFVTRDGRVKILDFGLAKLVDRAAGPESVTRDLVPETDAGAVMGTVGYMSPEQVRAKPVDHRSDIFSFGAVLYEMLSGARAFRGSSAVETMNAILKEDPPALTQTNRTLPPALERIVGHCLEKNPEERFQSARDIAFGLEALSGSSTTTAPLERPGVRWRPWAIAGLAALVLAGVFLGGRASVAQRPIVTFKPVTFQHGLVDQARFSADGTHVYYHALWPGSAPDIYVTQVGTPESRPLAVGAEALADVTRTGELLIRRATTGALAQVPVGGGAPRDILENVRDVDSGPDGTLAVVRDVVAGQNLEYPVGTMLAQAAGIRFPRISEDGALVAFSEHPLAGDFRGDVAVVGRDGKKKVLSHGWADIRGVAWSPDGREVWFTGTRMGAESSLWAVSMDGVERQVFRAPGSLALHEVRPDGRALLSVQRRRPVLYGRMATDTEERNLSWLDYGVATAISRDGKQLLFNEQGEGGGPEYATYVRGMDGSLPVRLGKGAAADLSPDGRWALVIDMKMPMQAVLLPTGAGQPRPLPRGPIVQLHGATFVATSSRVLLIANEAGRGTRLYLQDVAGGEPRSITEEGVFAAWRNVPVSSDGAHVAGLTPDGALSLFPLAGGAPRTVPGATRYELALAFSPDARHLYTVEVERSSTVMRVDVATGARQPWIEIKRDTANPAAFLNNIVIHPDGKTYAYTFRDDTSTLYLAEGLR